MKPILTEEILFNHIRLARQKNGVDGEWYGLSLLYVNHRHDEDSADNDAFLIETLLPKLKKRASTKNVKEVNELLTTYWGKSEFKEVRKIFKTAEMLGWFDYYVSES